MSTIRVGCCGFPKRRQTYFEHFDLVEIQQTFYEPPKLDTVEGWREKAPPGFSFTLKAWQLITHEASSPTYRKMKQAIPESECGRYGSFRPTDELFAAWNRTLEVAQVLQARVVVFQCPASFKPTPDNVANMRTFFRQIDRERLALAWEPRGPWPDSLVRELCQELNLIHCVDPFQRSSVHGAPAYFRLHGRSGYRYRYTEEDLAQLKTWCEQLADVYCLFNNVYMWESALRCRQLLAPPHLA